MVQLKRTRARRVRTLPYSSALCMLSMAAAQSSLPSAARVSREMRHKGFCRQWPADALFLERDETEAAVLLRRVVKRHAHVLDLAEGQERRVQHSFRDELIQAACERQ